MSADPSAGRGHSRSWWVRVGVVVAVLGVAAAAGLGVRWWTSPTAFGGLGDTIEAAPRPVAEAALSTTVIFPKVEGEPEVFRIDDVRAVLSEDSARARITFWICRMSEGESPFGGVHGPERYCQDIRPVEPGVEFRHGTAPDSDHLFVTIEPTRAGVARLHEVEVDYRRGAKRLYQRGTESIRADRTITAS